MMSSSSELIPTDISLIFSGDEYFVHLIEQINNAHSNIFIESYIFNLDPIGLKILNSLESARRRGVHVRLLVDGIGSYNWLHRLHAECASRNISFRIYHPLPFGIDFWYHISWNRLNRLLWFFRRINKRNHRKIALFDEQVVMMGSFNISQVHSETYLGNKAWRDSGLIAKNFSTNSDLKILQKAFNETWTTSRYFRRTNLRSFIRFGRAFKIVRSRFRLNSRTYWRFHLLRELNAKLIHAQTRIWITNAYFLPRKSILRNLRKVAAKGISVQLLLPEVTDVWFVREASRSLYERLLESGVRIFEYQNRVLHAKTLIVDDWATVGSHNLNHRSFNHDLEAEAVITEPSLINILTEQWKKDIKNSREITLEELGHITFPRKILARILYWFRFWI